ncbi:hypothetical protein [Pseudomonas aeruginosa]|uniref:hypothetical protein n=1 Tax=Pseudomonas aeruginosa TaxID=287 RepID=UPI000F82CEFC|nr:hypothetical protein [Pseudomonas aeruginosa]MBO3771981.1 hypothetical protein [Pseudomonas aeruginosa]MCD2811318.1 hypothetical protein [Pseudomonas aeruginosa]NQB35501.1 hypothetical protein [Pseudomonas aeruginosa]RTR86692.1 hypothetical protein DY930_00100 [Pseudomonas aeruginosa]RWX86823.1 hypothetical protein EQH79_25055 [Pseudomonas aeruginosa]
MQVDTDEIRAPWAPRIRPIGRFEWLAIITIGVTLGGLLKDGIELAIAKAVAERYVQEASQELRRSTERMKQESEAIRRSTALRSAEAEHLRLQQQTENERLKKLNSPECQFWTEQNQRNPSNKTRDGVSRNCP